MPCRGATNADKDFLESLDVISEIIDKYGHTCDVILTGDMNASLTRQTPNSRDSLFLNFIKDHHILIPSCMDETNTYYHPSGSSQTQIDYVLESKIGLICNYKTLKRHPLNTSQHDPVGIDLWIELDSIAGDTNAPTVQPRVNWDKINKS